MSKTSGFRHDSIPAGLTALGSLAEQQGWLLTQTEDSSLFSPDTLGATDAVIFLSTTGDIFNETEQEAFQQFVESGGGVVGIHSATDTEHDWPYFQDLLGAGFVDHPEVQQATILIEDPSHPATKELPNPWQHTDEWYNFDRDPRPGAHVLLTVDESTYQGGTMNADHPLAWTREEPSGSRVFYTAIGHLSEAYSDPTFVAHLSGGIRWVLGSTATP